MALAEQKLESSSYKGSVKLPEKSPTCVDPQESSAAILPAQDPSVRTVVAQESQLDSCRDNMEGIDYESLPTSNLTTHLCAGAAAGTMEHCLMYPVDCIKTRMMALNPDPRARYKGMFQAFHSIVTKEKPRMLFRGIGVVASGAGPAHAIYFACYEFSKNLLSGGSRSTVLSQGGAGAISCLLHDAFMNPIDVVKQRLQMYNSPYKGAFHCARTVYQSEGINAFYRSYTTQLSMSIPFQVIQFIGYEFLQDRLNYERKYDPKSHMLSGAGAGAFAATITNPLDVAKTLLNTRAQRLDVAGERKIVGVFNALREIYSKSGVRGYAKGITARVSYQMPSTAVCWSVYELFKHILGMTESHSSTKSDSLD